MEKQLEWAHKLGGVESLGIFKAGQMVLARLAESQIWHQPAGYMGEGLKKMVVFVRLHATHISVPSCMPLVPFKLLPQCWGSEEVSLRR